MIVDLLNFAFELWNGKVAEIVGLLTESPQTFKGGDIWRLMVSVNGGFQAVAYALAILFFAMSVFKSAAGFRDFKRPENVVRLLLRFVITKYVITFGMEIMLAVFDITMGITQIVVSRFTMFGDSITLSSEIETAINNLDFLWSILVFLFVAIGWLIIVAMSFVMVLTVYSRFFRLYLHTALAPIPLSTFAGEVTSSSGKAFIKSYIGVCLEGAAIMLSVMIYSAVMSSGILELGGMAAGADPVVTVFAYLAEVIFSMLVLVGLVKGSDRLVKELMGLM